VRVQKSELDNPDLAQVLMRVPRKQKDAFEKFITEQDALNQVSIERLHNE